MTDNSTIHYGKLTIRRKNKHLLDNLKYVSRRVNICGEIEQLPYNLEIASNLNIVAYCTNLDLKDINVHGYIRFDSNRIHKIYPSAKAKEYHIECYHGIRVFHSVYEIYEAFPHLVPDEFQNEYGLDHITIKDGQDIVPVVLGSINQKDIPNIIKAKYIVIYSAENQLQKVVTNDIDSKDFYNELYELLPDVED